MPIPAGGNPHDMTCVADQLGEGSFGAQARAGYRVPAAGSLLGLRHAVPFRQRSAAAALLAR